MQIRILPGALKELSAVSCQLSGLNKTSDLHGGDAIRVLSAPDSSYSDHLSASEQLLDLVRFEQRNKLDDLPAEWKKVVGMSFLSSQESAYPDFSGIITEMLPMPACLGVSYPNTNLFLLQAIHDIQLQEPITGVFNLFHPVRNGLPEQSSLPDLRQRPWQSLHRLMRSALK